MTSAGDRRLPAPRIEPVADAIPGGAGEIFDLARARTGNEPVNLFGTLAKHPALFADTSALATTVLTEGTLDVRVREIIVLRVAWNTWCEYEYGRHVPIGREAGLTDAQMAALAGAIPEHTVGFAPADGAVIDAVDQLCRADGVDDEIWAALAQELDERQLIELVLVVGFYRMLAGFINAVGVQLEPGIAGWPQPQ